MAFGHGLGRKQGIFCHGDGSAGLGDVPRGRRVKDMPDIGGGKSNSLAPIVRAFKKTYEKVTSTQRLTKKTLRNGRHDAASGGEKSWRERAARLLKNPREGQERKHELPTAARAFAFYIKIF